MESVPKIEGHAAFYTHLKSGQVDKARMIGLENDRFVEKILVGRQYWEAPIITSRICGICPTIHNTTANRAIEAACGIEVTEQTKTLRKLMLAGQMIQSHSLHLYLLVLPDFVGSSSSFELQKNHPELFKNAIELKRYADKIIETIGGRAVHPIASVPGGFKSYPTKNKLKELLDSSADILEIAEQTVALFKSFKYPKVEREMIYSALESKGEYAFYEGNIRASKRKAFAPELYSEYLVEKLKPYTRAKFATLKGKTIMVGAIARMNLNGLPSEQVGKLLKEFKIKLPFTNPFDNIIAQAIENYYFVELSIEILKKIISDGVKEEKLVEPKKFGKGTSACEAPRGTLFHYYELDKEGFIKKCDIVTPTVQSLPALESDMKKIGPILAKLRPDERTAMIEMLIRSYDPCITCATH
ncbi:MAG: Ni/Fe hydrogenase subunit alpha [Patescibacteria group bacterium]|jgi:sulfhydrogenase subunit alpha